jgi:CHAT domain
VRRLWFLQAGIPSVVATLWLVDDQSTAVLVAEFYRLLLTELQDTATALARARGGQPGHRERGIMTAKYLPPRPAASLHATGWSQDARRPLALFPRVRLRPQADPERGLHAELPLHALFSRPEAGRCLGHRDHLGPVDLVYAPAGHDDRRALG